MIMNQKFKDFISGLVAGVISVTVCNPLDIARTRLNIMSSPNHSGNKYANFGHILKVMWQEEGIRGFYTGYRVNVKAIPIFHSLFFPIYETIKHKCEQRKMSKWVQYFFSAITAGAVCNICTNPIWVVRTRIMVQYLHPEEYHYKTDSIIGIMKEMVKEEGYHSLFRGLSASIFGISNAVIYFMIYETFKQKIAQQGLLFNSYFVTLASITSKFIASTLTYPLIVVRTVMHDHRTSQEMGFAKVMKFIWKQRGLQGFYGGLKPDLIRLLPSNAIVFIVYEYMKRIL